MLRAHAIDLVATDAHDTRRRPVCMKAAYEKLCDQYGKRYARRLVRFGRRIGDRKETKGE